MAKDVCALRNWARTDLLCSDVGCAKPCYRHLSAPFSFLEKGFFVPIVLKNNIESKKIADIKLIYEYKEFYYIVFQYGEKSHNFICQKSLISRGTLSEFEEKFNDKIIKRRIEKYLKWE